MQAPERAARILLACVALALAAFVLADPLMLALGALFAHGQARALVLGYPARLRADMERAGLRYMPYAQIPACARLGIVSVEDKRFFTNTGIDLLAIARVAAQSVVNDHRDHGGSTITQQLARIVIGVPRNEPNPLVKALGLMRILRYTLILNHEFPKPRILELYFNAVYFGRHAQGLAQAAKAYFHADPAQLALGQCFYLTGLPQAPAVFGRDPSGAAAMQRYRHVLATLVRNGYIAEPAARALERGDLFGRAGESSRRDAIAGARPVLHGRYPPFERGGS